jgi:hypothetical protein
VQQTVDALFDLDERTVIGEVANLAGDQLARWVAVGDLVAFVNALMSTPPSPSPLLQRELF